MSSPLHLLVKCFLTLHKDRRSLCSKSGNTVEQPRALFNTHQVNVYIVT